MRWLYGVLLVLGCGSRTGIADPDVTVLTDAAPGTLPPGAVPGASPPGRTMAVGFQHGCAIDGGRVRCWGFNGAGQLGDGTLVDRMTAVDVVDLEGVVEIAAGGNATCARTATGEVYCWGDNHFGQVGSRFAKRFIDRPQRVPGIRARSIAVGAGQSCAVLENGGVSCWGTHVTLDLGLLITAPCAETGSCDPTPHRIGGLADVRVIAPGIRSSCAVTADSAVWCWGDNQHGQLGDGTTTDRTAPTRVRELTARSVGVGKSHACALRADGTVQCWGLNVFGRLGISEGSTETCPRSDAPEIVPTPTPVRSLADAIDLAVGVNHTCALRSGGTVECWGSNTTGELGNGRLVPHCVGSPLRVLEIRDVRALGAGSSLSCALRETPWCWGHNHFGQLGDGTTTDRSVAAPTKW